MNYKCDHSGSYKNSTWAAVGPRSSSKLYLVCLVLIDNLSNEVSGVIFIRKKMVKIVRVLGSAGAKGSKTGIAYHTILIVLKSSNRSRVQIGFVGLLNCSAISFFSHVKLNQHSVHKSSL